MSSEGGVPRWCIVKHGGIGFATSPSQLPVQEFIKVLFRAYSPNAQTEKNMIYIVTLRYKTDCALLPFGGLSIGYQNIGETSTWNIAWKDDSKATSNVMYTFLFSEKYQHTPKISSDFSQFKGNMISSTVLSLLVSCRIGASQFFGFFNIIINKLHYLKC